MEMNHKKPCFRMLMLITTPKRIKKAMDLFQKGHVPLQYQFRAQGTVTRETLDLLGLESTEKMVLMSMLPKVFADQMLDKLQRCLGLGYEDSGIAFTLAITGGSARIVQLLETLQSEEKMPIERNEKEMSASEYVMIMAMVNQGYSEEAMAAARSAGATGGTVFHSRRVGNEETLKFWGISVQEERETLMIVAKKENKMPIMKAINEKCGMHTEAHGIAISLPVDQVAGLE